jgi:parallel beta-helix repeat protein
MGKRLSLRLALAAVLPALATITWVTGAAAVTSITTCGPLTKFGETYNLANDLTSCGTCLTVANNRITINFKNYVIIGDCDGGPTPALADIAAGVSDGGVARDLTTVRDGVIVGFDAGIDLTSSTRSTVLNMGTGGNLLAGIAVGDNSLVKGNLSVFNFVDGIVVGERSQVQDNEASLNGFDGFGDGIYAGNRCLITRNSAQGNAEEGIATGGSCTVSFNTASGNGDDGIDVGADGDFDGSRSLVTGNTADDNGDVGIEAQCPSTVTFNSASGNGLNYNLFGTPPCDAHNNTGTGTPP